MLDAAAVATGAGTTGAWASALCTCCANTGVVPTGAAGAAFANPHAWQNRLSAGFGCWQRGQLHPLAGGEALGVGAIIVAAHAGLPALPSAAAAISGVGVGAATRGAFERSVIPQSRQ